jgi:hypothetical protein
MLVDVSVEIDGVQATRLYPRTMPDLFAEDQLVVSGRLKGTGTAKFTIKGKLGGKPVVFTRTAEVSKSVPRRWVGGLWAQARIEHLLEELALNGNQPELHDEVIDLALAYNFVTPFTAFLAIPESELGEMAGTVAAAREKKAKILATHQDAAALGGTSVDKNAPAPRQSIDISDPSSTTQGSFTAMNGAPPSPKYDRVARRDSSPDRTGADSDDEGDVRPVAATGEVSGRHGCAGCASNGNAGGTLLLAFLTMVIAGARRGRRGKR